jgi:hypothetical protein
MLASPAGSKVVKPGFERLAHFVPIAAIVIQTATTLTGRCPGNALTPACEGVG